jgi:hypothetical protein
LIVDQKLGRQLQDLLTLCNESLESFSKAAVLNGIELNQISQGQFTASYAKKVIAGFEKLAPDLNQRLNQHRIEWVSLRASDVKKLVVRVRKPLEDMHALLRESNEAGSTVSVISTAQKVQLIALLKSLLAELEGEFVERGRLKSIAIWIGGIIAKGAAKNIEDAITPGLKDVFEAIKDFINGLSEKPSSSIPEDKGDA